MALGSIVDTKALLDVVWAAAAAGLGVTLVFSLAIFGAARFEDMRRADRAVGAASMGLLSLVCLAGCAAAIVGGILVMTDK